MVSILAIDDKEPNLELYRIIFDKQPYRFIKAQSGKEGVELALQQTPDLILMDIQMPDMDGIETFQLLQSYESTKKIPVIAITSYAMKGDKESLLKLGFTDYVPKPIRYKEFLKVIQSILQRTPAMKEK